jgi:hypothetical protein
VRGGVERLSPAVVVLRLALVLLLAPLLPLLAMPLPGRVRFQRGCCRLVLRCFGVRVMTTGGPVRNLRGVLVVSAHTSWLDVFVVGAVSPGMFVARADLISWPGIGALARLMRIIPIDRDSLRRLPSVVEAVAARLRAGRTLVASMRRLITARRTIAQVHVASLQLPGADRRELAARCQAAVGCRARPSRRACIFC